MDGLKAGRIVYFVFDEQSAQEVMRRRTTGGSIAERIATGSWPVGAQAHIGNPVQAGDVAPAMVAKVWSAEGTCNLKVILDGADEYWATSVVYSADEAVPRTWHWMFEGQAQRYDATLPH